MHMQDEPVLGHDFDWQLSSSAESITLPERIRRLVNEEPFAVLCTQGEGQPYGSVVAFAFNDDLTAAVFATPMTIRKFHLLMASDRVALLVDNRPKFPDDMMQVEAITATGRASRVEPGPQYDRWVHVLTARHPYLKSFVTATSCALFCVEIVRYFHVVRFQEVQQWIPTANG